MREEQMPDEQFGFCAGGSDGGHVAAALPGGFDIHDRDSEFMLPV